jgi:hypothetical protein
MFSKRIPRNQQRPLIAGLRHSATNLVLCASALAFCACGAAREPTSESASPVVNACPGLLSSPFSTRLYGGSGDESAYAVITDWDECAIYAGGETSDVSSVLNDGVLNRYSTTGALVWTVEVAGLSYDSILDLAVDSEHNVYATGYTYSTLPGSLTQGQGGPDVFIIKYDPDGIMQWSRQLGTVGNDRGYAIAIGANDEIYVAGVAGGLLPLARVHHGKWDIFIAKFDTSGNHLWTKEHGTADSESAADIAIGPSGNLYVTGSTNGTLNAADGYAGMDDLFLGKYDANGNQLWIHQRGTSKDDYADAVAVNQDAQVFLTGATQGNLDGHVNQGSYDIIVLSYDDNGPWRWTDQRGTSEPDRGSGIAVNQLGNPYTVGQTGRNLDGNVSAGGFDLFLMKHGRAGAWTWTKQYGSSGTDMAYAVTVSESNDEYVVGYTDGKLGGAVNAGCDDAFALKYDNQGVLR